LLSFLKRYVLIQNALNIFFECPKIGINVE